MLHRRLLGHDLLANVRLGGVGKSALVTKVAMEIKGQFEYVIWRSLRNAPPIEEILRECIQFIADQQQLEIPQRVDKQIMTCRYGILALVNARGNCKNIPIG